MIHDYPYSDFHELNLDYLIDLCMRTMGIHLENKGDFLCLINQAGDEVSKLKIHYADTALEDVDGKSIKAYVFDAGVEDRMLVLTRGNGETVTITIPYATMAEKDVHNVDIDSYVHGVGVSGNKILITFGNGTTYNFTVPFATKASQDENGKNITSYVASVTAGIDKLVITDGDGVTLGEVTVPYATKALNDVDGDHIKETYATDLTTGVNTVILRDKVGNVLSEITVPFATRSAQDDDGNVLRSDYGYHLSTSGDKIGIESHNGTTLNEITVPFATKATDAINAIEAVQLSGDNISFITFGGQTITITVPYAVKALKDSMNNTFTTSYIANAVNDPLTGKITFYAQDGSVIAEMTPTVDRAVHDSLGNTIADYVKTIVTNPNSDYVTVTHGDGDADSLTVHYATRAYKDTYGNIIGNVYIRSLDVQTDAVTGHKVLIAYNGELSELFRLDLDAYSAVVDINGNDITDYVKNITVNNNTVTVYDGDGNVVNTFTLDNSKPINILIRDNTTPIDYDSFDVRQNLDVVSIYDTETGTTITIPELHDAIVAGRDVVVRFRDNVVGHDFYYLNMVFGLKDDGSGLYGDNGTTRAEIDFCVNNALQNNRMCSLYLDIDNVNDTLEAFIVVRYDLNVINKFDDTVTPSNGDVLVYNNTTNQYEPAQISTLSLGYLSFGTLNTSNDTFTAPISLSVLESHKNNLHHVYITGSTITGYVVPYMVLAEVYSSVTGITTTYSGLSDAITLLKTSSEYTLTYTIYMMTVGSPSTTYKVVMTAGYSDNTLTVTSVTTI